MDLRNFLPLTFFLSIFSYSYSFQIQYDLFHDVDNKFHQAHRLPADLCDCSILKIHASVRRRDRKRKTKQLDIC